MNRTFLFSPWSLLLLTPLLPAETVVLPPEAVSGLSVAGDAGAPTVSPVTPVGDTIFVRARDFSIGPVRGNLNYLRFDLSTLTNPSIQQATLVLNRVAGDAVVTGRVALFGMLDLSGNAAQDWNTTSFEAGAELDVSMFEDFTASVDASPVNLAQVADFSEEDAVSGNTVSLSSEAFLAFLQERANNNGLATVLLTIPSLGEGVDRDISYASHAYSDEALRPRLEIVYFDANLPSPPENLRVSNIALSAHPSVTLEWDPVPGALNYRLFRRAPDATDPELIATASTTGHIDPSVNLLETFHYSVTVETADGESIRSPELEVTIMDPGAEVPAVPTGFTLTTADPTMIAFSWETSAGALLYEVYRSTFPDRGYAHLGSVTTNAFSDSDGIVSYQTYYYTIAVIGAGGMSAFSDPFEVGPRFTGAGDPPAAPHGLAVVNREHYTIGIEWTAASEADGYYVHRSPYPTGGFQLRGVVTDSEFIDDYGIYPEQDYFYFVRAINAADFSQESATVHVPAASTVHRKAEPLSRAPVAVSTEDGVYVGWRLLGTDPFDLTFNVYRDGERVNDDPISGRTNLVDPEGDVDSTYTVHAVIDRMEIRTGTPFEVLDNNYASIPLQVPDGGTTPDGVTYTYSANDGSLADLDGDGEYEFILKWDPSNSKDNSQAGYTGNVYLDAYELDGTLLWRIDLGHNIRAGAHYTQFMVYDFDGDGRAELICKTADATVDGVGNVIGDPSADWRNSAGYVLDGPEYLTAFDGQTGAAIDTTDYIPQRGNVADWGDTYGNRVDRFLAGVAYFDGVRPSYFAARGQYRGQGGTDGRTVIAAFDLIDGELVQRWVLDSLVDGREWAGQGHHQLSVGDVDGDGRDEILYGGMAVDDDGTGLYSTEYGTGDAMHFGDLDPTRPGREVFSVKEDASAPVHVEYRDAATGDLIWGVNNGRDTGRGLAADIDPTYPGSEVWGAANLNVWNSQGDVIGVIRPSINFATWWTGNLQREMTDGISVRRWDYVTQQEVEIMVANGTASNNGTKANSTLQGDLLGDWREEVVFRAVDSSELRIYTTTDPTAHRIATLMHDPNYRLAIAWQNNGYNQPPHPSFFIGNNMPTAPMPRIFVDPIPALVGKLQDGVYLTPVQVVLGVNRSLGLRNEYRINGGAWTLYDRAVMHLQDGATTIEFRTLDAKDTVLASASIDVTLDLPVPGDLNGDLEVDRHDRKVILDGFWSKEGDPGYAPRADYNGNDQIDPQDLTLWTQVFINSRTDG